MDDPIRFIPPRTLRPYCPQTTNSALALAAIRFVLQPSHCSVIFCSLNPRPSKTALFQRCSPSRVFDELRWRFAPMTGARPERLRNRRGFREEKFDSRSRK
jgi:hypothetical protein